MTKKKEECVNCDVVIKKRGRKSKKEIEQSKEKKII